MKAVVAAFNQEKALVGAFSVITNLRMALFKALVRGPARSTSDGRPLARWYWGAAEVSSEDTARESRAVITPEPQSVDGQLFPG